MSRKRKEGRHRHHLKVTSAVPHHFFVVDADKAWRPLLVDSEGRTLVYLDRAQALRAAEEKYRDDSLVIGVVGMGDAKWSLFQQQIPYTIVPLERK